MKIKFTDKPTGLDVLDTCFIYETDSVHGYFSKPTGKKIQLKFGEVYEVNRMNNESYIVDVDGGEVVVHKSSATKI